MNSRLPLIVVRPTLGLSPISPFIIGALSFWAVVTRMFISTHNSAYDNAVNEVLDETLSEIRLYSRQKRMFTHQKHILMAHA